MKHSLTNIQSVLWLILLCFGCQKDDTDNAVTAGPAIFELKDNAHTNLHFKNELPIDIKLNILSYMYYYNGGGAGAGDLNNDGLIDIVLSANLGKEAVYINEGNLKFRDVADIAQVDGGENSWTNGVALADVNGDGYLDIYLSQVSDYEFLDAGNKLFIFQKLDENNNPIYEEKAAEYGLGFKGFSTQAGFFDYDLDGDLDMYLLNHSLHQNGTFGQREKFLNKQDEKSGDRLYENRNGKFVDVTKQAGIYSSAVGYGLGLAFGYINSDEYPDIYVGNDFHENDYLYINNGDGTFTDALPKMMRHTSRFSMGVDIADVNNDGLQDMVSLDMLPEDPEILKESEGEDALDIFNFKLRYGYNHQYARNALQLNQGNGTFKEIGAYANVYATDWSWSPLIFDFDMDGVKDLFVSNGIPKRMNDIDYINFISGHDVQYKIQFDHLEKKDLSVLEKIPEIKLPNKFFKGTASLVYQDLDHRIAHQESSYSNSAVYADFDNDGDYDILTNNIDDEPFLYENKTHQSKTTKVELTGSGQNTAAIGSTIIAHYADRKERQDYFPTKGFQSSMLPQVLVPSEGLDSVTVIPPGGGRQRLAFNAQESPVRFRDVEDVISYAHTENPFVEFNREPLIPFSTSSDGPALAIGDINGDGREDVFVGSSKRRRNAVLIQNEKGVFDQQIFPALLQDSTYEEVDAVLEDFDGDQDLDLLIATGGNEYRLNSPYTEMLFYENDDGNLTRKEDAFDDLHLTASTVATYDMDGDGDLDVFIGGRAVPRQYGAIPNAYLLENNGKGQFKDVTEKWSDHLKTTGFVKDAKWADMNGDGKKDLVLAKEWGNISVFYNQNNTLKEQPVSEKTGWWNTLEIADFNNDGQPDIFAGNIGLNGRLKPTAAQPVRLYFNDFDDNGTPEQIMTYYVNGRNLMFSNIHELQKQIPSIKKQFLFAKDFSKATPADIMGKDKRQSADVFEAKTFETMLFLNKGNENFEPAELPKDIQYSSINAALAEDLNQDGKMDLILGGNYFDCNVQMGRYDAEQGSYLLNLGDGQFVYHNMDNTPLKGQVKQIKKIKIGKKEYVIVAQNDEVVKVLAVER